MNRFIAPFCLGQPRAWMRAAFQPALVAFVLALALLPARSEEPDDQFLRAYNLILQGDSLSSSNLNSNALEKYQAAQNVLLNLQKKNPNWNASVVSFRLEYVSGKVAALSGTPGPSGVRSNAPSGSRANAAAATSSAPQVKLLDAGAEPRKALRLHPKTGATQNVTMNMDVGMEINLAGTPTPMKLPTMILPTDITVQEVSPQGDITYQMVMGEMTVGETAGVMPQVLEAMKQSLGGIKGLTSTFKISTRGFTEAVEMKVPAGADPQLRQAMDQMRESLAHLATPLPEEPVGPGARWEATMPVKSQGMTLDQTATYQLNSAEGDLVKLKSTVTQTAANQKIQSPAMPGMKVDLTKMTGHGEGELTLDLAKIAPQQADIQFHSDMTMGVNMGNQKQSMDMKLDVKMTVQSK